MRDLNLTHRQTELTLEVFRQAEATAKDAAGEGGFVALLAMASSVASLAEKKLLRRLAGIWTSPPAVLKLAEDSGDWTDVDDRGADLPMSETAEGLAAFFGGLGISPTSFAGSSPAETTGTTAPPQPPADSPSGSSSS